MSQRNLVLGSVASLALASALLAVAPGYAQSLPRYPTAAEEAQTDALNAQQASAPATTAVIVAANPDSGYSAAIAQQSAAQSQYNAQLQDYQDRASAYEKQKQDYQAQVESYKGEHTLYRAQASDYAEDEHEYDRATAPPATVIVHDGLVDFDDLRDPDSELAGLPIEDRAGYLVGHFRHMTHQDGREEAVITLHNNKSVVLDDEHLRFDPVKDVVVADLSFNELNSMPARF
ncbi:MAG TPA: hypothetical protein VK479_15435 [Micropepsaceae bacterium]|nr:hypothetical protein [Micropepsaceae bacterium]